MFLSVPQFGVGHLFNVMGPHMSPSERKDGKVPGYQWSTPQGEYSPMFL